MEIKKGLVGLVLGTSIMVAGSFGADYFLSRLSHEKDLIREYKKIVEVNDEKVKQGIDNILPLETIVDYKNKIERYSYFKDTSAEMGSLLIAFGIFGGAIINCISVYSLVKGVRKPNRCPKNYTPPILNNEEPEIPEIEIHKIETPAETEFINPWEVEIPKYEGKK